MTKHSITDEQYRAFIGDKKVRFYFQRFRSFEKRRNPFSWNWSAFFFTWVWAAYRKMYGMAALFVVFQLIVLGPPVATIFVPASSGTLPPPFVFLSVVILIVQILVGSLSNKIYHRCALKKIASPAVSHSEQSEQLRYLHRVGGTNRVVVWIIVIFMSTIVIGIASALIIPHIVVDGRERLAKARLQVDGLADALTIYQLDNGTYPSLKQGLNALLERPAGSPVPSNWRSYISALPTDPWGRSYEYEYPGRHGEFDVYSLGADGQRGGEGADADIGNW